MSVAFGEVRDKVQKLYCRSCALGRRAPWSIVVIIAKYLTE